MLLTSKASALLACGATKPRPQWMGRGQLQSAGAQFNLLWRDQGIRNSMDNSVSGQLPQVIMEALLW